MQTIFTGNITKYDPLFINKIKNSIKVPAKNRKYILPVFGTLYLCAIMLLATSYRPSNNVSDITLYIM